ncbi:mediator of RNA polymerase II transcription subunit 29 [Macrosteles quadrilineatus]|uniref:mediator of RNA polymerase II transcription subunit 29 n=1 Tax=Macrosteles quadrilineatus TaxID=74068 RepID=UPI0023E350DC|nr:mediator of RNA polymerase II transcription subunit 29 [Macrosteles quadrilineatus]
MNIPPMQQGPVLQQVMSQQPGTQNAPQMQPQMPQPHSQEKLDNISKVKSLIGQLRESLAVTLKNAAHALHQNSQIDVGTVKSVDMPPPPRFDKSMEEFYSICDQIELHLKTSIECVNQGTSSQRYLPLAVAPTRTEPIPNQDMSTLTYPQYLATVRAQVMYAKEIHDMLLAAAQNITATE